MELLTAAPPICPLAKKSRDPKNHMTASGRLDSPPANLSTDTHQPSRPYITVLLQVEVLTAATPLCPLTHTHTHRPSRGLIGGAPLTQVTVTMSTSKTPGNSKFSLVSRSTVESSVRVYIPNTVVTSRFGDTLSSLPFELAL